MMETRFSQVPVLQKRLPVMISTPQIHGTDRKVYKEEPYILLLRDRWTEDEWVGGLLLYEKIGH